MCVRSENNALLRLLQCTVEEKKSVAPLTTMGVGGRVAFYAEPALEEDFLLLQRFAKAEGLPMWVLGGGSNALFADGDLNALLVSTRRWNVANWMPMEDNARLLSVQSGCILSSLVRESMKNGLTGLEFACGIPGSIGGAVAGNAGAGGKGVGQLVVKVVSLEEKGEVREWDSSEFVAQYRNFSLTAPGRVFLSFCFRLTRAPMDDIDFCYKRFAGARACQPRGARSAGCSFKNPAGNSAGRLLDESGCKGMSRGGASVSMEHANFIINHGDATAADVVALMRECRSRVYEYTGVLLEPEIRFFGVEF